MTWYTKARPSTASRMGSCLCCSCSHTVVPKQQTTERHPQPPPTAESDPRDGQTRRSPEAEKGVTKGQQKEKTGQSTQGTPSQSSVAGGASELTTTYGYKCSAREDSCRAKWRMCVNMRVQHRMCVQCACTSHTYCRNSEAETSKRRLLNMHENKTNSSEKLVGHDLPTPGDGIPRRERKTGCAGRLNTLTAANRTGKAGKDGNVALLLQWAPAASFVSSRRRNRRRSSRQVGRSSAETCWHR